MNKFYILNVDEYFNSMDFWVHFDGREYNFLTSVDSNHIPNELIKLFFNGQQSVYNLSNHSGNIVIVVTPQVEMIKFRL